MMMYAYILTNLYYQVVKVVRCNSPKLDKLCDFLYRPVLYNWFGSLDGNALKGLAQAKIIKKSVILFRVLNMTI